MFGPDADEWMIRWLWTISMETPMRVAIKTLEIYLDLNYVDIRRELATLDCPGVIYHGVYDQAATVADAEAIATNVFRNGTFVSFENSGHAPFLDEPTRFNEEIVEFLEN